mmetsp:Transcript_1625/g.3742  ORF Transcript_1625/g.3742 Transcript_1625/m.3742 type:complete len:202 (+) Transcript_1625:118-723(+)
MAGLRGAVPGRDGACLPGPRETVRRARDSTLRHIQHGFDGYEADDSQRQKSRLFAKDPAAGQTNRGRLFSPRLRWGDLRLGLRCRPDRLRARSRYPRRGPAKDRRRARGVRAPQHRPFERRLLRLIGFQRPGRGVLERARFRIDPRGSHALFGLHAGRRHRPRRCAYRGGGQAQQVAQEGRVDVCGGRSLERNGRVFERCG